MFDQHLITLPPEVAHMALFAHVGDAPEYDPNDPELSRDPQYRAYAGRLISIQSKIERIEAKAEKTDAELDRLDDLLAEADEMIGLLEERGFKLTSNGRRSQPPGMEPRISINDRGGLFANATGANANAGFRNFGEFIQSVGATVQGHYDQRLQQPRAEFREGVGADGGFLVPPAFRQEILGPALVESGILSRVNVVPMPNGALTVAGADTENHTGGSIGGLELKWTAENEQLSQQTPSIRSISLKAKKGSIFTYASNELLYDAPNASGQLQQMFSDAARYGLEAAVLTGNGVGQPLGMLNSDAVVSVAKETSQTADTIVRENTVRMLSRLHPGLVRNAIWCANPDTLPQLLELAHRFENAAGSDFVGGSTEPVMVEAGEYRLHGLPLVFSEALPTVGDLNDLVLVDPSQYLFGSTLDVSIQASPHERFGYDQTAFRLIVRVDGQPAWSQAMTPENGSTLSAFVNLAERA